VRAKKSVKERSWGLMLIALSLALLLEAYFYSADNSATTSVPATVEVRDLSPDRMITEPPKGEKGIPVLIEIRGPRPLVDQVRSSVNKFTVFVPATNPTEFTTVLDPQQLKLPAAVEVLSINPSSITIKTEPIVKKEVPVVVDRVGKPAEGFEIEDIFVSPGTVEVSGPESRVEKMQAIATYPVDVSNLKSPEVTDVSLEVSDSLITVKDVTLVAVDIRVGPVRTERTFDNVGIKVLGADGYAATVEPSRASLVLSGPAEEIKALSVASIALIADGRSLPPGRHKLALTGEFGQGVRIIKTVPAEVTVNLVKKNG
jgi:YbbR domain-containing protein